MKILSNQLCKTHVIKKYLDYIVKTLMTKRYLNLNNFRSSTY